MMMEKVTICEMSSSPTFLARAVCEAAQQNVRVQCMAGTCPSTGGCQRSFSSVGRGSIQSHNTAFAPSLWLLVLMILASVCSVSCASMVCLVGALKSCFPGVQMLASSRRKEEFAFRSVSSSCSELFLMQWIWLCKVLEPLGKAGHGVYIARWCGGFARLLGPCF